MILGFFTHGNNGIGSIREVTSILGLPTSTSIAMLENFVDFGFFYP
jgi:DNA-binding IclR family transcriptional regulator